MQNPQEQAIGYEPFIGHYIVLEMNGDQPPQVTYCIEDDNGNTIPVTFEDKEWAEDEAWELMEQAYNEIDDDDPLTASILLDDMKYDIAYADMDDNGHVIVYNQKGLIMEFFCHEHFK